jgi:hypothetical protein
MEKKNTASLQPWGIDLGTRDGNGKEIGKWLSEISQFISILGDGNWTEIGKRLSKISEIVSMRIRSVFTPTWHH